MFLVSKHTALKMLQRFQTLILDKKYEQKNRKVARFLARKLFASNDFRLE